MAYERWALTVDERGGRLVRIDRTERGSIHAETADEIREEWAGHEHGRPSSRIGKGGHSNASIGHEPETRRARFAKAVAAWIDDRIDRVGIDHALVVFAPPSFLGALRDAWSPRVAGRVEAHPCGLAHLSLADLARHPSVEAIMVGTHAGGA